MNAEYPYPMNLVSLRSELNATSIQSRYPVFYESVTNSIDFLAKELGLPIITIY